MVGVGVPDVCTFWLHTYSRAGEAGAESVWTAAADWHQCLGIGVLLAVTSGVLSFTVVYRCVDQWSGCWRVDGCCCCTPRHVLGRVHRLVLYP